MSELAYISVGANVGDCRVNIDASIARLDAVEGVRVIRQSDLIETEPIGGPVDQPTYLNGAVEVETTLSARELLDVLLSIESKLGRVRTERWGPRVIDLDLVLFGEQVIREPRLTVPHPHMHERGFVLGPLAQIAPHVRHPVLGKTVSELFRELQASSPQG